MVVEDETSVWLVSFWKDFVLIKIQKTSEKMTS